MTLSKNALLVQIKTSPNAKLTFFVHIKQLYLYDDDKVNYLGYVYKLNTIILILGERVPGEKINKPAARAAGTIE